MFYALSWFVVFILIAFWSLAAWTLHSIVAWTVANAGVLAGESSAVEAMRVPDWLSPWVPQELTAAFTSALAAFTPAIEAALGWAPDALAGGLSLAVWVLWALGSALLIVLGLVLSGLIAAFSRRAPGSTTPAGGPAPMR